MSGANEEFVVRSTHEHFQLPRAVVGYVSRLHPSCRNRVIVVRRIFPAICDVNAVGVVLLCDIVSSSPGCAQLRADHQRGRDSAHANGDQGWRYNDQASLLRGTLNFI